MERLRDEFEDLVVQFTAVLGPTHDVQRGPEPKARWDRTNLIVRLSALGGYINLHLVNPAYQEWLDTTEESWTCE
ncbi:DUF6301 family protein [Nocardia sp. NPDC004711]